MILKKMKIDIIILHVDPWAFLSSQRLSHLPDPPDQLTRHCSYQIPLVSAALSTGYAL